MSQDLRRIIARKLQDEEQRRQDEDARIYELQKNHSGRHRWTAEAWLAGIEANRNRPEPRFPIIIGPESMFKTAEELGIFLDIPAVAPVTETKAASLDHLESDEPVPGDKSYHISHLDMGQLHNLKDRTNGERITIIFQGERRTAWLPRGSKMEQDGCGDGSEQQAVNGAARADMAAKTENKEDNTKDSAGVRETNPNRRVIRSLKDLGIP
ncbi:hypothetical protein QBC42DRAFT_278522 [Cladorrhinum samala]|uniref:Uncharacterized protein n=1 Tax=Cladorrhinum samala TaxID=585594 RepID=A0AAV9HBU0_9PEZI|nr:hypothetical protein QBC42DRAFT_278522 [Cladorrhinum samala]